MVQSGDSLQQLGNFALALTIWVLVVVGTFDTVRKLTRFGYSRRLALYVGTLAVLSGLIGGSYYWLSHKQAQLVALLEPQHNQLPEEWAIDQSVDRRHEGSKAYAIAAFRGEGVLLKYVDRDGKWVELQPSMEDIAQHDAAITSRMRLGEQSQLFWRLALEWWLGCLIAAVVGFVAGGGLRRLAANSTLHTDARASAAPSQPPSARAGERER